MEITSWQLANAKLAEVGGRLKNNGMCSGFVSYLHYTSFVPELASLFLLILFMFMCELNLPLEDQKIKKIVNIRTKMNVWTKKNYHNYKD